MMRVLDQSASFLSVVTPNAKRITATTKNAAAALLLLVFFLSAATEAAAGCTEELISFSACLPYVSYPPNNLTESASKKCCEEFSSAVESESVCLCYLIRQPLILGFPLNTTRLHSLSSLCSTSTSFPFLCSSSSSESSALPPLNSALPTQTEGSSASLSGAGGGGSRGKGGGSYGSGTTVVPTFTGAGGGSQHRSSHVSTLTTSQFLSIHLATIFLTTCHLYNSC
ncbi:hypothetical protein AAZX31_01G220600 [Glycine max]|uniref:Bifunctional inhibitor/plant lipid transfer protein/seed storage helical domain-containing protein n=1 Tax=Glycine max TaxID=3847 RepID=K7K5H8_SOYBN|nr:non-specific lipid transfer protein GPI-anchored 25 [Glycine max]KAG5070366.1 hypothetical protein JHK85_002743 [Glycine max]KAH1164403.1 hypothetical protein GYH30_002434 [Glycine max]KAH1267762.1 Non-specific lipid transfer protein GPI-anchored 2 [Glycine max]KRH77814.1 hypothetical protein GLYMA_01G235100v4 [Glycine max]|eukprot:XP_006573863.1 non-specific lipid-transfer protein C6 [Glycine max]